MSHQVIHLTGLLPFLLPMMLAGGSQRTVIDKEAGIIFEQPNGSSWSTFGAVVGSPPLNSLDPNALLVTYGRFHIFGPHDDTVTRGFPYSALRQYEASQVAAGQPPIFVTATYEGQSRPVLWSWSLKLVNGVPTAPSSSWQYAVNVQDERFIKFWISQYARPILMQPLYSTPNVWIELDDCAFNWGIYGVLDDNNNFVAGVPWDPPFPQNSSAYLTSVATFFSTVKQLAPDILTMPNLGSMTNPGEFPTVFANVPGVMHENIFSWNSNATAYTRNNIYTQMFTALSWAGSQNKVAILRALVPSNDSAALQTAFVTYSLMKGPNFFFAPGISGTTNAVDPSSWSGMDAELGNSLSAFQTQQATGMGAGYLLYSRTFSSGYVYLNLTGSTQTVKLPTGHTWHDPNGNIITQIQIPDLTGTYVTAASGTVTEEPHITPRFAAPAEGPLSVTIASDIPDATIRYTLDGTDPAFYGASMSPLYTGPLSLSKNTVVTAKAQVPGDLPSYSSAASYTISATIPTVQFAMASDSGLAGGYYPVLQLSSILTGTVSVNYAVTQPTGSVTSGTVTFLPGKVYQYFPISTSGSSGAITTVTITGASGAAIGATNSFEFKML